jgi:hypothetical protein
METYNVVASTGDYDGAANVRGNIDIEAPLIIGV